MRYVIIALLLGGCALTVEHATVTCTSYGFTPGSLQMAQCVQQEMLAHKNRAAIGQGNSIRAYDAMQKNFR